MHGACTEHARGMHGACTSHARGMHGRARRGVPGCAGWRRAVASVLVFNLATLAQALAAVWWSSATYGGWHCFGLPTLPRMVI